MKNQFSVDEISANISKDEFVANYVANNKPAIIRGFASEWQAVKTWDLNAMLEHFGGLNVLCSQSASHKHPDLNNACHNRHIPKPIKMSDYLQSCASSSAQDASKLALNRLIFDSGEGCNYRHHIQLSKVNRDFIQPELIDKSNFEIGVLWVQAQSTQSWVHTDAFENLFVQVRGKKRFVLFAPEDARYMYNTRKFGAYCEVDVFSPDLVKHPLYEKATAIEVCLDAGDLLYLPAFWFHAVESIDFFNISMNWWYRPESLIVSQPSLQYLLKKVNELAAKGITTDVEKQKFMKTVDELNTIISIPEQADVNHFYR